jgi:hypothetical protein
MPGERRRGGLGTRAATCSTSAGSAVGSQAAGERPRISRSAADACGTTGPEEASDPAIGNEQGREVLDVEVAEGVGVVLDVDPGEVGLAAELRRQCAKVAPYSRQATHHAAHRQATQGRSDDTAAA